jgi:uroporphyrinogen-III synthase
LENKINILSTRLLSNQKQRLLEAGFEVAEIDFIVTESISFELKVSSDFLIFTSQNAVKSVIQHQHFSSVKSKKCFCVGQKTKQLLEENEFEVIHFSEYAEELATFILAHCLKNSFTFFSGNLRRDTVPEALTKGNIVFREIGVYQTILKPQKIKVKSDGILFFSPSAVESYLTANTIENEMCFCIGTTTANVLVSELRDKTKNIQIASKPLVEHVIDEVIKYYK